MKTMRKFFTQPSLAIQAIALIIVADLAALAPGAAMATVAIAGFSLFSTAPSAQAIPPYYYRRGPIERGVDRRVARRTARRTARRVTRRNMVWAMPAMATAFWWGGHQYYRSGGLYYYPYFVSGQTVYVEIEVDAQGHPLPPPPASEIEININIDD